MEFMQWRPCKPYIISMLASASAGELGKIVSAPAEISSRTPKRRFPILDYGATQKQGADAQNDVRGATCSR